jgi:hypothetical protein
MFSTTHSDCLRVPCELGLPAALALLLAGGFAVRELRRKRARAELPAEADGAVAALIAGAVHGLVDNPSGWPAAYLLGSALLGAVLVSRPWRPASPWSLATRLPLACAVLLVYLVADVGPYLAWRRIDGLARGGLDGDGVARLEAALRLNPLHPDHWLRRAEHLAAPEGEWDLEGYARARESAEHAVRLQPADARYRRGLARLEAAAARTLLPERATRDRAVMHYEQAAALARHDPSLWVELAALLLDTGDAAAARGAAERALALEPEAVLPRLLLAGAWLGQRTPEGVQHATRLLEEARERSARWGGVPAEPYARDLMRLDAGVVARLERDIAASPVSRSAGTATLEAP